MWDMCDCVYGGGEKEAGILASTVRLTNKKNGNTMEVQEDTIERQCDKEFFDPIKEKIEWADAILSMACGVGVQFCSEVFREKEYYQR